MTFELTPEEMDALRTALPQIRALESLIARSERIGVDVSAEKAELARRKGLIQGMIREFGQRRGTTPTG
jgi:hypothetical protein